MDEVAKPYQKDSGGKFLGTANSGTGTTAKTSSSSSSAKKYSYLGAGYDVAEQYHPSGWASYITVGGHDKNTGELLGGNRGGEYTKTDAKHQMWMTDPNSGSFKRLNYYYQQLPAAAKKKWKSASSYWNWAVDLSYGRMSLAGNGTSGGVKQGPWDVMGEFMTLSPEMQSMLVKQSGSGPRGGSGRQSLAGTTTSKDVNLTNKQDAKLLVNQVYQQLVGREATAAELAGFTTGLNKQEAANPVYTTTTTDARGRVVSQKRKGGTNAQEIAKENAEANPEYHKNQAQTTYLNAFLNAINSPVSGA